METDKATALANKINKISAKFAEKLDDAEELVVVADDLTIDTQSVLKEVKDLPANMSFNLDLIPQILNLENMMSDVKYIRETLHTSTELGRRLLSVISQEIEFDPNAELLSSYSELSATLTKNMELFLSCYKDISNILINISKLTQQQNPKSVVNNISINSDSKVQSTAELIKQLAQLK
jgi:hypothetical protein